MVTLRGCLNHRFSVLDITETWTTPLNENVIDIPGYSKMLKSRTRGRGGGVGLLFDNNLEIGTKIRDDLACPDTKIMERLFVQISQTKLAVKDVIVGVIYRPPNTNVIVFCDSLSQILDKINKEDRPCYLLGDFNIDLINSQSETLLYVLLPNGFYPRIDRPTRITDDSATLIDNIFINTHADNIKSGVWLLDVSDHFGIFITLPYNTVNKSTAPNFSYKRCFSEEYMTLFKNKLSTIDWTTVYKCPPPWPSLIGPKFCCTFDPQNWQIRSDLGCNSTWPSLAPNSVSYSIQTQLHHEQLPGWPCTRVLDRALPLREWHPSKTQPSVVVSGSAPGSSISEGTIWSKRFLRLLTTAVEFTSCWHSTSPQWTSTFQEET